MAEDHASADEVHDPCLGYCVCGCGATAKLPDHCVCGASKDWHTPRAERVVPEDTPTREWLIKRCAWYQSELDRLTARDQALAVLEAQLRADVGTDGGTDYSDYRRGMNEAFSACADAIAGLLAGPPKE